MIVVQPIDGIATCRGLCPTGATFNHDLTFSLSLMLILGLVSKRPWTRGLSLYMHLRNHVTRSEGIIKDSVNIQLMSGLLLRLIDKPAVRA